ncbi:glycosyltransferase family 4 protein [Tessaracoccus sp. ZS01]|uniref:glycosyltransferase family 4 protein n=1 Tax=Tessaracoccus sp. ZS01 TaxID=1906324 RepID=UPI00096EE593|nr:glycosyltransferase family 4 protein [Tessaracoccus sp. ZS01]OMG54299.1 hypothetical protein BJN44_10490 [Tessaracoccus sp. ZS01]
MPEHSAAPQILVVADDLATQPVLERAAAYRAAGFEVTCTLIDDVAGSTAIPDVDLVVAWLQSDTFREWHSNWASHLESAADLGNWLEDFGGQRNAPWLPYGELFSRHRNVHYLTDATTDTHHAAVLLRVPIHRVHSIRRFVEPTANRSSQRSSALQVVAIQPFHGWGDAPDLLVDSILELARRDCFERTTFQITGWGRLFEESVAPLRRFRNIALEEQEVPRREAMRRIGQADVLLSPMRAHSREGYLLEAMSAGVVPVTTELDGIDELVINRSTAMLGRPETPASHAIACEELVKDPALLVQLANSASAAVAVGRARTVTIEQEISLVRSLATDRSS